MGLDGVFADKEFFGDLAIAQAVARQVKVGTKAPEISHALRDWRNLVHPAAAVKYYADESKLKPESVGAAALFAILTRDISEIA